MAKTLTKKQREKLKDVVFAAIVAAVVVVLMFPFFVMVVISFMSDKEIYAANKLLPEIWMFWHYQPHKYVVKIAKLLYANYIPKGYTLDLLKWTGNTLIVAGFNIVGIVSSAFLCAYGFAKVHFKFKSIIFGIMMASTMLPSITLRIPLYIMYSEWGWLDGSLKPLTIPAFFGGGAMNVFLIMQFVKGIPNSTLESARLDGANELRCLFSIVLPCCLPIVALICVTTFLGVWNDYSSALTYLSESPDKWTLSLGVYKKILMSEGEIGENQQMALGILMSIPPLLIFGFSQKLLIEGVSISGMKA